MTKVGSSASPFVDNRTLVLPRKLLTKSVAVLYGPKGIRANAVAPGAVKTNIEAPFKSEWAQERLGPLMAIVPTIAEAEELAASITWLASSDASNVNGVILPVDGGWAAI